MAFVKIADTVISGDAIVSFSFFYTGDALSGSLSSDGSNPFQLEPGISQLVDVSSEVYINITNQVITEITINSGGEGNGSLSSLNISNAIFNILTSITVFNHSLLTTITWPSFTGTLASIDLSDNALTSAAQDAIILKVWDNAISKASTGKTFNILDNDGTYSAQSAAYLTALDIYRDWNINTGNGALIGVTNISNVADLQLVAFNLAGTIVQTKDIDASITSAWNGGAGFVPINLFAGTFDGKGYSITGLYINRPTVDYQGLFGYVNKGCLVENLHVDGNVTGKYFSGIMYGHGEAAGTGNLATFRNCYTSGVFAAVSTGGGFAGRLWASICENCYSTATGNGVSIGGFIGQTNYVSGSNIINCHAYSGKPFIGVMPDFVATVISKSKQLTAYPTWTAGTYAGRTIKELNGVVYVALVSTSNQPPHADWAIADIKTLTAAEFKVQSNFVDWDFSTIWTMGASYPELRIFASVKSTMRSLGSGRNIRFLIGIGNMRLVNTGGNMRSFRGVR